jgi:hypothetical protein
MCVKSFFPDPPKPAPLPPAAKPDPIITETKPKITPLLDPEKIAKVDYGSQADKKNEAPKVTADSLKINLGTNAPGSAATGGINNVS